MACVTEALWMSLAGSASIPATHADRIRCAEATGRAATQMTQDGQPAGAILTPAAFRNALVGTVTLLGLEAGWLLAGTVYIETVFAWPGLGSMLVNAILQRDYPLVQGGVLLVATTYVLINLATDALYVYLDPRLRHA